MEPDEIRQNIELNVVEFIKQKLTNGTMTEERSKQISRVVLDALKPGMGMKELYKAIFTLDDTCQELSPIVLPYAKEYEKNVTQKATEIVRGYIKVGQYDAAVKLAKDAINQDVQLQWSGSSKTH
jgi:hypothetical protein